MRRCDIRVLVSLFPPVVYKQGIFRFHWVHTKNPLLMRHMLRRVTHRLRISGNGWEIYIYIYPIEAIYKRRKYIELRQFFRRVCESFLRRNDFRILHFFFLFCDQPNQLNNIRCRHDAPRWWRELLMNVNAHVHQAFILIILFFFIFRFYINFSSFVLYTWAFLLFAIRWAWGQ